MFKSLINLTTPYLKNHISKLSNSFKTKMNTQDIEKFTNNYTWKKLTNLNDNIDEVSLERSSHTVNFFNEKIYVFGGEHNPRIPINNHLLVYDLKSNKWEYVESNNSNVKPSSRLGHASCQNGDKLFVFGGRTGFEMGESSLNDLFVFDIKENIWTELKKSNVSDVWPEARSYHTMTSLKNKLYLFGGCSANQGRLNDLYEYDLNENKWKHLNSDEKIVARGGSSLCAYENENESCLYLVGGFCGKELDDCYHYNIKENKWTLIDSLPRKLSVFACSAVNDKSYEGKLRLILHGGEIDPSTLGHNGAGEFSNDTYIFDGQKWHMLNNSSPLKPSSRGWHASAFGSNGIFYVFGGNLENNQRTNELWSLNLCK